VTALIVAAICAAYLAVALYAARSLYGRIRAHSIDVNRDRYPLSYGTVEAAVKSWDELDRGPVMALAALCALAWPLAAVVVPLGVLAYRFMSSTPILSQSELQARVAERDKRIAELEREAGLRP
jgi:hypothetical protein